MSLLNTSSFLTTTYSYIQLQMQMAHPSVIKKAGAICLTYAGNTNSYATWNS